MIFLAAALIGMLGAAGVETEPPNPVDAFFAEYAAKRDGVKVLEANFLQKQILPDDVVTTRGSLLYVRPRRVVLRIRGRYQLARSRLPFDPRARGSRPL